MRNLMTLKTCSACLMVLAAAACGGSAGSDDPGNQVNAAAENEILPPVEAPGAANSATPARPAGPAGAAGGSTAAKPGGAAAAYEGYGLEPFWNLTIGKGQMRYELNGETVSEPLPARTPIRNGYRYAGKKMIVEIVHKPCQIAAEDVHPDEVRIRLGSEEREGCGGTPGERG